MKKSVGIWLMIIGAFILLFSFRFTITGNVIGSLDGNSFIFIVGLVFVVGGAMMFASSSQYSTSGLEKMVIPPSLKDMVGASDFPNPNFIIPDTQFLWYLDKGGKKGSAIDLSGYNLKIPEEVLRESQRKLNDSHVMNYLTSKNLDSEIIPDFEIPEAHKNAMKKAWEFCIDQWEGRTNKYEEIIGDWKDNKYRTYNEVDHNILKGADGKILSYALSHPNEKILILSKDKHIETLSKLFNIKYKTNIKTFSVEDYNVGLKH